VLGLSLYAWNCNLSLAVAKRFKAENPETIIFAGGPSVPDNAEEFLRKNPFIDIAVHNEGEIPVKMILESIAGGIGIDGIPSTSKLYGDEYHKLENISKIEDLSEIPSPFLTGTLDRLIKENPDESWIGLWETNRGCPFTCTYCDWGSATGSKKIGMFEM